MYAQTFFKRRVKEIFDLKNHTLIILLITNLNKDF